jgi:hypothetical protein
MPTALSDPSLTMYLVLAVFAIVTGALWVKNRTRSSLVRFGIATGILVLLFLIDWLFESPREEASRRVKAMADTATAVNPDAFVENLSPSFNYHGADREKIRHAGAWSLIRQHSARVAVWGLGRDDFMQISENEIEIGFYAKAQAPSNEAQLRYVKAVFTRDPDGAYRLKTFRFYTPGVSGRAEEPIQNFP